MNGEFKKFVRDYIERCDEVLRKSDIRKAEELQELIINTFGEFIPNITSTLDNYEYSFGESRQVDFLGDINKLKEKLRLLSITGGGYSIKDKRLNSVVTVTNNNDNGINNSGNSTNNNTNTVNNTIDIKAELYKIREKIEDDEILDDNSKEEIQSKLNEIETVMDENPSNNEKWKKLKSVITWTTTKGYKIGEMIMPLLIKVLFPGQ